MWEIRGEGSFQHNEHLLTHCDHSLDCRKNVYPFEEISLDDPGSSNGELAGWLLWSASFIPVSTKVTS